MPSKADRFAGALGFAKVRIKKNELEPGLDLGISHFEWRSFTVSSVVCL